MIGSPTYRPRYQLVALGLALVFAVFNVGLPIVVYACPMMQQNASALPCCADNFSGSGSQIGRAIDRSCCKTVVAGERNTTEFVQAKDHQSQVHTPITPLFHQNAVEIMTVQGVSPQRHIAAAVASPPDIPVLFSSLLI
ncbi:MAG TPA: hypothetical protein VL633_13860 [Bacteroidota bacterium]|jgi:hypothetical protein|nr:hypothetical protein [Bacteroidota bacterium]